MISGGDCSWLEVRGTAPEFSLFPPVPPHSIAELGCELAELSGTDDTIVYQQSGLSWEAYSKRVEVDGRQYVVQFSRDMWHNGVAKLFNDSGGLLSSSTTSTADGTLIAKGGDAAIFASAIYAATGRIVEVRDNAVGVSVTIRGGVVDFNNFWGAL